MTKFHPRFKQAHDSHRTRNERDIKLEAKWTTAPFFVGQDLRVVDRDHNTILVAYLDGRQETAVLRLEVVADDQEENPPRGGELTRGEKQAFRDGYEARGDDDNRDRELPDGVE